MPRCKALTKNGDQCRNNAIPGTSFCYISAHGTIHKTRWQKLLNFLRNQWQPIVAVASLAVAALTVYWYFQDKKLNATSGLISSPTQSAPMSISVGSMEFHMLSKDGVVFSEGEDPLLAIRSANGKLLVTARIRDANGALIAEMNDNEWKHQQRPAIFDRNYTQDVLEIRDSTGQVVLQVANVGNTIDVSAIFHCRSGWTYKVGRLPGGSGVELRPPGERLRTDIAPICSYPSESHLGSCPGVERLRQMISGPHTTYTLYFPVHLCL